MAELTKEEFSGIVPGADADRWLEALNAAMARWEINSGQRMAAFLAQVVHESGGLTRLEENLRYSSKRLCQVWPKRFKDVEASTPYANNPEKLANRVYAGRLGNGDEASGDGWRFRGRGLIQLTGRSNYASCAKALEIDVVESPNTLLEPLTASLSAGWFWSSRGLNELADHNPGDDDEQDFTRITIVINGGKVGLAQRVDLWKRAQGVLGA